jgi:citrate synthase
MTMAYIPGLAGIPATESAISYIDGQEGILTYRGYNIAELAQHSSFEETALLLLTGDLPSEDALDSFSSRLADNRRVKYNIREMMMCLPATTHPMHMLQTVVASLASFYPSTDYNFKLKDEDVNAYIKDVSEKILAHMGTLVAMWEHLRNGYDPIPPRKDLSYAGNILYMLNGNDPDPDWERLLDACLILHAEHTINASTFTAIVTGSTLANPCAVVSAAIGSLSGPLHGAANEKVLAMLEDVGKPENARHYIEQRLLNKEVIWGMGHREYKTKDPRAVILQKLIEKHVISKGGKLSRLFETAIAVEEVCKDLLGHKGVYPNVDFYSGILYKEMGFHPASFTSIFAIARAAGWLAHWREQLTNNKIYRPTQVYVGDFDRKYVPLNKR